MKRRLLIRYLDRISRRLNIAALWLGGIALVFMAVHVSFDAFGKYLFSLPIPATLEVVAYYYMPAVVALPMAWVEGKDGHVSVEMLFDRLPACWQAVVRGINDVVMMGFIGLLTWLAGREAIRKFDIGEYMFGEYPIIIWPGRFVFALGLALLVLIALVKLIRLVLAVGEEGDPVLQQSTGDAT